MTLNLYLGIARGRAVARQRTTLHTMQAAFRSLMSDLAGRQGLGNRLPSIVTAFALALLTDRVLFVDDTNGRYFGMFWPTFNCSYTQSRREVLQIMAPGWIPRGAPVTRV